MLKGILVVVGIVVMGMLISVVWTLIVNPTKDIANGQHYFCPGPNGLFRIIQTEPDFKARFMCKDKEKTFDVDFTSYPDSSLINRVSDRREPVGGLGVLSSMGIGIILQEGRIVQMYEVHRFRILMLMTGSVETLWRGRPTTNFSCANPQ